MKYCINCKHYEGFTLSNVEICVSPNLPIDLVSGRPKFSLCKDQRYNTWTSNIQPSSYCGQGATWFEPKVFEPTNIEDADLDDLSKIPFGR